MPKRWTTAGAVFTAIAIALVALASGLPADTFSVGDSGVKLIAAQNALARPEAPLEIPLPALDGEPLPYLDPFFARHGDHAHAITPEAFPLATAPLLAAFGTRGVYVLPALGLLMALAGGAWLALALDDRRSPVLVMLTILLGTPLLYYGLEFWEHAPAAGLASAATAVLVTASGRETRAGLWWFVSAGLLFGAAVLLRPETIWFAVAVLAAAPWLPVAPSKKAVASVALGIAVALLPVGLYTLTHFGSLLTPHLAGNPALWGDGWLSRRAHIVAGWFLHAGPRSFWRVAPAALLALVPLSSGFRRSGRPFLASVALGATGLIVLTAPNDGGSQWGPRYLLPVSVPIAVLAADALAGAIARQRIAGVLVVACVFGGGAWVQRASYKALRDTKTTYGRILGFVREMTPPGGYVVSDLWWLDQVAAVAATERRVFLYAADDAAGARILQRLGDGRAESVTVIRSRVESPGVEPWSQSACYGEDERREIPDRALVGVRFSRRCL